MEILNLSGITKQLDGNSVLENISFTQQQFQKIAIAGETGAGKTTLLKIIGGLLQKDAGLITFEQRNVLGPEEQLIAGNNGIAYISQNFELRNNYRVEEELDYTNQLSEEDASRLFEICRINHLLKRWTDELSGGEKQRIVTARALIAAPRLLLLDEPFSNLDMAHKQIMKGVIDGITEQLKMTCILVSHDPTDTLSWAEKILVLKNGVLIQQGAPLELYMQPANEYVAALFGKYSLIDNGHIHLFAHLRGIKQEGKNIMIRPEHVKIVKANEPSVEAIVKKTRYFGSYLEVDVMVDDITITLTTTPGAVLQNDIINISLEKEAVWYL